VTTYQPACTPVYSQPVCTPVYTQPVCTPRIYVSGGYHNWGHCGRGSISIGFSGTFGGRGCDW
jgi:hypothetical protein